MSYYDRNRITHLDGTMIFQNDTDRSNEQEVALLLSEAWKCSVRSFGALSPIDWYAERHGRLVGLLELKARPHASTRFNTVFLNVRKWLALSLAQVGLGCPAIFVVRFSDGIFFCPLALIDGRMNEIAGCNHLVKSGNDIEPVIKVDISVMKPLVVEPIDIIFDEPTP